MLYYGFYGIPYFKVIFQVHYLLISYANNLLFCKRRLHPWALYTILGYTGFNQF